MGGVYTARQQTACCITHHIEVVLEHDQENDEVRETLEPACHASPHGQRQRIPLALSAEPWVSPEFHRHVNAQVEQHSDKDEVHSELDAVVLELELALPVRSQARDDPARSRQTREPVDEHEFGHDGHDRVDLRERAGPFGR